MRPVLATFVLIVGGSAQQVLRGASYSALCFQVKHARVSQSVSTYD